MHETHSHLISGLTATATDAILIDVIEQLLMRDTQVFKRSFDRPNLR